MHMAFGSLREWTFIILHDYEMQKNLQIPQLILCILFGVVTDVGVLRSGFVSAGDCCQLRRRRRYHCQGSSRRGIDDGRHCDGQIGCQIGYQIDCLSDGIRRDRRQDCRESVV
jgi:hypothetical protein